VQKFEGEKNLSMILFHAKPAKEIYAKSAKTSKNNSTKLMKFCLCGLGEPPEAAIATFA